MSELAERRRFERALHDGVQQDLIALAVRLQLARQLLGNDVDAAAQLLEELRRDVHATIDSLRSVAADIYPSLLDARGLRHALRNTPQVRVHVEGRHPREIEAAVYFCCLEAAVPGAEVDVREEGDELRITLHGTTGSQRLRELAGTAGGSIEVDGDRVVVRFYESAR